MKVLRKARNSDRSSACASDEKCYTSATRLDYFWNILATCQKSLGLFWKNVTAIGKSALWLLFEKTGLLFIPTSGHTGHILWTGFNPSNIIIEGDL